MLLEIAYFWLILFLFFFIFWGTLEGAKGIQKELCKVVLKNEQEVLAKLSLQFKDL
jgi:hypothetical protein